MQMFVNKLCWENLTNKNTKILKLLCNACFKARNYKI